MDKIDPKRLRNKQDFLFYEMFSAYAAKTMSRETNIKNRVDVINLKNENKNKDNLAI